MEKPLYLYEITRENPDLNAIAACPGMDEALEVSHRLPGQPLSIRLMSMEDVTGPVARTLPAPRLRLNQAARVDAVAADMYAGPYLYLVEGADFAREFLAPLLVLSPDTAQALPAARTVGPVLEPVSLRPAWGQALHVHGLG